MSNVFLNRMELDNDVLQKKRMMRKDEVINSTILDL